MRKVDTSENLADALTKHVSAEELNYHIASTGQIIMPGRHDLAPSVCDINYVSNFVDNNFDNYSLVHCSRGSNYVYFDCCKSTCLCTGRCAISAFRGHYSRAMMAKEECRINGYRSGQHGPCHYSLPCHSPIHHYLSGSSLCHPRCWVGSRCMRQSD